MACSKVVLPEPDPPMMAMTSPRWTTALTFRMMSPSLTSTFALSSSLAFFELHRRTELVTTCGMGIGMGVGM